MLNKFIKFNCWTESGPMFIALTLITFGYQLAVSEYNELNQLSREIQEYDQFLGITLHRQQLRLWSNETRIFELDPNAENTFLDEPKIFYCKYVHWAEKRFNQFCLVDNRNDWKNISFEYYCHYLFDVLTEFGRYHCDFSDKQNENSELMKMNKMIRNLTSQLREIKIKHQGQSLMCQESLEQLMMKSNNPKELKSIWIKCHRKLNSGTIPEVFQSIRSLLFGDNFKGD